jgi:penicillin amidase
VHSTSSTTQTLCSSVYGPVLAVSGGVGYALANSTFGNEMTTYEAWMALGRVRSFAEFRQRVAQVAHNFNVFYADDAGNIAHFHAGRIPVRAPGANRLFPQPGDGTMDWRGAVPFSDMPHSVNPERGWLVNWNNKPGPDWPYATSGFFDWGPVHRVETLFRIVEQVPEGSAGLDTLAATNRQAGFTTDSPSGNADTVVVSTMLGEMLDLVDTGADTRLSGAVALLRGWDWLQTDDDGDGRYDSPAVAVFNTWWQATLESIIFPEVGTAADRTVAGNLVHRLIQGNAAALPVQGDYLGSRTIGQALTQSLIAALDTLAATYGTTDAAAWLQPRSEIVWAPGGIGTVPNTIWMNRGTYNQLVHLGHGAGLYALNVISPGQSGDFRSPHFADQLELYATWRYKPMRLSRDDQVRQAASVTVLRVP